MKSYDERSLRLALHFLADEPDASAADAHELALEIQDTIETWIEHTLRPRLAFRDAPVTPRSPSAD